MSNLGQLRITTHLRCMCGADLGQVQGFVKCKCGMSYDLNLSTWLLGNGHFDGTLHVMDDVRPETVQYLELARIAASATEHFKSLFQENGIPKPGVSRKQLQAARDQADRAQQLEREFVRAIHKAEAA